MHIAGELARILSLDSEDQLQLGDEMYDKDGFLSFRRRVTVKRSSDEKPLKLFLKMSDASRTELQHMQEASSFFCKNECVFYSMFALIFDSVLSKCQLERVYPKSYGQRFNDKGSLLLMEDLASIGFRTADRLLSLQQAQSVMKAFGRMQAAFWIARAEINFSADATLLGSDSPFCDQIPKATAAGKFNVQGILDINMPYFFEHFASFVANPDDVEVIRAGMKKVEPKANSILTDLEKYDDSVPLGFVHGDCWRSNFLFKEQEEGQLPQCRVLDWQLWSIGKFGRDLGVLFLTSISNDVFNAEVENLFDLFYLTFKEIFEEKMGQPVPFDLEAARRNLAVSLTYGLVWVLVTAHTALTADAVPVGNMYANVADAIRYKLPDLM